MGKRFEWVELGSSAMKAARQRKGLSYEGAARMLSVSAKTYERYEKRGAVPVHEVWNVAHALGLEIQQPDPVSVRLAPPEAANVDAADLAAQMTQLQERLFDLSEGVREIREALGIGEGLRGRFPPRRAANGDE